MAMYTPVKHQPLSHNFMEYPPPSQWHGLHDQSKTTYDTRCTKFSRVIVDASSRASQQTHLAVAKALMTPVTATICFVLGHALLRNAGNEYRAPLYKSALAGFVGGQCLMGSVVILNVILDMRPISGTRWYRYFTFPAILVVCVACGGAGPLGVMIINSNVRPNTIVLDVFHAFYASASGAALVFWTLMIIKFILYCTSLPMASCACYQSNDTFFVVKNRKGRRRDAIENYNSSSNTCGSCNGCDCNGDCGCSCCSCDGCGSCDCGGC